MKKILCILRAYIIKIVSLALLLHSFQAFCMLSGRDIELKGGISLSCYGSDDDDMPEIEEEEFLHNDQIEEQVYQGVGDFSQLPSELIVDDILHFLDAPDDLLNFMSAGTLAYYYGLYHFAYCGRKITFEKGAGANIGLFCYFVEQGELVYNSEVPLDRLSRVVVFLRNSLKTFFANKKINRKIIRKLGLQRSDFNEMINKINYKFINNAWRDEPLEVQASAKIIKKIIKKYKQENACYYRRNSIAFMICMAFFLFLGYSLVIGFPVLTVIFHAPIRVTDECSCMPQYGDFTPLDILQSIFDRSLRLRYECFQEELSGSYRTEGNYIFKKGSNYNPSLEDVCKKMQDIAHKSVVLSKTFFDICKCDAYTGNLLFSYDYYEEPFNEATYRYYCSVYEIPIFEVRYYLYSRYGYCTYPEVGDYDIGSLQEAEQACKQYLQKYNTSVPFKVPPVVEFENYSCLCGPEQIKGEWESEDCRPSGKAICLQGNDDWSRLFSFELWDTNMEVCEDGQQEQTCRALFNGD